MSNPDDTRGDVMADSKRAIVVTGSRKWEYRDPILDMLADIRPDLVIHGDCPTGADSMAAGYARAQGTQCLVMPAQWSVHGRAAGPYRNLEMVRLAEALRACGWYVTCEAFPLPDGRGTVDCMKRMKAAGFEVNEHAEPTDPHA